MFCLRIRLSGPKADSLGPEGGCYPGWNRTGEGLGSHIEFHGLLKSLLLLAATLCATPAFAQSDSCEFYKKFLPKLYNINCRGGGAGRDSPKPGGGYSSFAGAFNLNPAAAPTDPSPYGLELIGSRARTSEEIDPRLSFGLIKGFKKVGAAVATAGNDTFYGNDIIQRKFGEDTTPPPQPWEAPRGKLPSFNLGTAFELGPQEGHGIITPALGVSLRYNRPTDTLGFGSGLAVGGGPFSAGFGIAREQIASFLPPLWFYSVLGGVKLGPVQIEYTQLWNSTIRGAEDLEPIQILTATVGVRRAILSAAVRKLNYPKLDPGGVERIQFHGSVQYQLFDHLALGYLYNYIPGMHSVAAQIFF